MWRTTFIMPWRVWNIRLTRISGSPPDWWFARDGSGHLCDQYAQQYDWVISWAKVNGGLSDARNYGGLESQGRLDWYFPVDPDDYPPGTLRLGTHAASRATSRTQADMVSGKSRANSSLSSLSQNFHLDQLDLDQVKVYDKCSASDWDALWTL